MSQAAIAACRAHHGQILSLAAANPGCPIVVCAIPEGIGPKFSKIFGAKEPVFVLSKISTIALSRTLEIMGDSEAAAWLLDAEGSGESLRVLVVMHSNLARIVYHKTLGRFQLSGPAS